MAAKIKLFSSCFCTVARFSVQAKYYSRIATKNIIQVNQRSALTKIDHLNASTQRLQRQCISSPCIFIENNTNSPDHTNRFKQLEPPNQTYFPKLLQNNTNAANFLKGLPRTFIFRRKKNEDPDKKNKRIPKLILVQNPFTWLLTKIDFIVLRKIWDSGFQEKEFKYGTKQAISKVTNVISDGQYTELNGLLTKAARLSLMRELDRNWNEKQRSLLALKHEDIQISSPRKVYFIRIADKKFCDVDMAFLALKWAPINSIDALIFTEIFARFHREYTPHSIPEWTIAYFKVTRFEVLRRKSK